MGFFYLPGKFYSGAMPHIPASRAGIPGNSGKNSFFAILALLGTKIALYE
jgi:hypothetical protein